MYNIFLQTGGWNDRMCGAHVDSKGYVCKAAQIPVRNNVGGPTNCSQVVLIAMPQSLFTFSLCIEEQRYMNDFAVTDT